MSIGSWRTKMVPPPFNRDDMTKRESMREALDESSDDVARLVTQIDEIARCLPRMVRSFKLETIRSAADRVCLQSQALHLSILVLSAEEAFVKDVERLAASVSHFWLLVRRTRHSMELNSAVRVCLAAVSRLQGHCRLWQAVGPVAVPTIDAST